LEVAAALALVETLRDRVRLRGFKNPSGREYIARRQQSILN